MNDICRGQGEALNVDRHQLYQALFSALAAAPLGSLEPLRSAASQQQQQGSNVPDQATTAVSNAGRGGTAGSRVKGAVKGVEEARQKRPGAGRGRVNAAGDEVLEQLPFDVLLAQTANLMLVEQVIISLT